jgi:profilin
MSWQDYVDKQLIGSGRVKEAAICGLDGNVWARSGTFNVSTHVFSHNNDIQPNGIVFQP